jgi:multiple antibiotic resistance protein
MDVGIILSMVISLFLILDPFASLPMFLAITKDLDEKTVRSYANKAVLVATVLLIVFIFFGQDIMGLFGVTMDSFRVAGGIIFLMMAIELVFGFKMSHSDGEKGAAWAVIASPVLTGPGVITAAVLLSTENGLVPVLIASIAALTMTWIILRMSSKIMHVVGEQALSIFTKVIGLFIASMGVQSIFAGSLGWFQANMNVVSQIISTFAM